MKAWNEPRMELWGMSYWTGLTDEFQELIDLAEDKIKPFSNKEISQLVCYFEVKGEDVSSEFDCCDDEKCIKEAKKEIRKQYGKGAHIKACYSYNDGDHEDIETCSVCGKPLNEWLGWCQYELEYLEENKPWTAEFLKEQGFLIHCILQSTPTTDYAISDYAKHQGGEILQNALQDRENFFERVGQLAQAVIDADFVTC